VEDTLEIERLMRTRGVERGTFSGGWRIPDMVDSRELSGN
jgi:hypothetical protein